MKKFFAVIALAGMMIAVSAPSVMAANGKKATVVGIDDKEKKEKKKKSKAKTCTTAEGKSCAKGDAKTCAKGDAKSCCKGKSEAKTTETKTQ